MNYYSHHIGDYTTDTAHLSILEDGAYRRLMDRYYTTEAPLPVDEAALFRLVRARGNDEQEAVRIVLVEFFQPTEAGWVHKRCELEIAAFKEKSTKAADAANKRWHKPGNASAMQVHCERSADAMPTQCEGNADAMPTNNQEPITNNHKPEGQKHSAAAPKYSARADLLASGVAEQTASDWLKLRAAKKAPASKTALDAVRREAALAGLSLDGALAICCTRGWQGFKAEWVTQQPAARAGPGRTTGSVYDQTMAAAERAKEKIFGSAARRGAQHDAG